MLEFSGLEIALGGVPIVSALDLAVAEGEFVVLLGPSGCGKTTLLRAIAGMIAPSGGYCATRSARCAFVFQEPRLAPWLDAVDNAAFGLKARGVARTPRRAAARKLLLQLGLAPGDLDKRPAALSGGMRQRVSIARALAVEPQLLLMDEPFAALDVGLRRRLQDLVAGLAGARRVTALFVTHDITEAMRLATRIVVLSPRPARIVADLRNTPLRDPALIHEAAAALLRREEVADALLGVEAEPAPPRAAPDESAPRNCLRCERCECSSV